MSYVYFLLNWKWTFFLTVTLYSRRVPCNLVWLLVKQFECPLLTFRRLRVVKNISFKELFLWPEQIALSQFLASTFIPSLSLSPIPFYLMAEWNLNILLVIKWWSVHTPIDPFLEDWILNWNLKVLPDSNLSNSNFILGSFSLCNTVQCLLKGRPWMTSRL